MTATKPYTQRDPSKISRDYATAARHGDHAKLDRIVASGALDILRSALDKQEGHWRAVLAKGAQS